MDSLIATILTSSATSALVAWFIRHRELIKQEQWRLKRDACLEALEIVDAVYSHAVWSDGRAPVRQAVDTAKARACFNKLVLSCSGMSVVKAFESALSLSTSGSPSPAMTPEKLVVLRNAIRRELGFGNDLEFKGSLAWIARLSADEKANESPK
jgi:hypothetical protein